MLLTRLASSTAMSALEFIFRARRSLRTWVTDRGDIRAAPASATIYPWINKLMIEIMRSTPGLRVEYLWGSLHGANLARSLGIESVSLIEFGVAGGTGLVSLERIGHEIERHLSVETHVYGFDTGAGLPRPHDVRDCPNLFAEGDYGIDADKLRARLTSTRLILGPVAETLETFISSTPPPCAFVSFDLDLYTSTRDALLLFSGNTEMLLPRVHCYFDDVTGFTYGDFNGARLAVAEFNERNDNRKVSRLYAMSHYVPARCANDLWPKKLFMAHILDHPLYGEPDGLVRIAERPLAS